jgi:two-component system, sensor histidine kinase
MDENTDGRNSILIVEDEGIAAADIQSRLSRLGYRIVGRARSGEDAIREIEEHAPDIVLMDIHLHGKIDGIAAAEVIRDRYDIPVIFITAYADRQTLQRVKRTEASGYILKPFKERELHSNIELALYKHQVSRRLREAKELAENTSRAKSEFLANFSHELRTPLNTIIGMTALAEKEISDPEVGDYLRMARSAGEELLRLINSILDYTKLEYGTEEIELSEFDLVNALSEIVEKYLFQTNEKGVDLLLEVADGVYTGYEGDVYKIHRILTNVIGNAVKFTEDGSIRITVIGGQSGCVSVRIVDTGIGIPPDRLATIFEPFTQVDGSSTRRFGGVGLGLSLVKRYVDLMGGGVRVDSNPDAGTTVLLRLPLRPVTQRIVDDGPIPIGSISGRVESGQVNAVSVEGSPTAPNPDTADSDISIREEWDRLRSRIESGGADGVTGMVRELRRRFEGNAGLDEMLFRLQLACRKNDTPKAVSLLSQIEYALLEGERRKR